MIKPNISGGNPQIPGSFTSIEVDDKLVAMVRGAGGKVTVVDSDMIWTKFDAVAKLEGWYDWAREKNVPLVNFAKTRKARFDFWEGSAAVLHR